MLFIRYIDSVMILAYFAIIVFTALAVGLALKSLAVL